MPQAHASHLTGADDRDGPPLEPAQDPLGQNRAGLHEPGRRRPDRGLRPGPATGPHRSSEQRVQRGPRRPLMGSQAVRRPDLRQDLRLAEEHRIQPGRYRVQMLGRILLVVRVERVGELVGRDLLRLRQEPLQIEEAGVIGLDLGVDLDAVARGQHDALPDGIEVPGAPVGLRQLVLAEREALEQLDRSSAVRHSQGEDGHQRDSGPVRTNA